MVLGAQAVPTALLTALPAMASSLGAASAAVYELASASTDLATADAFGKKKKAAHVGKPCQSKPDLDNVLKGFMDALRTNDASVYAVSASKFWSEQPGVVLSVRVPSPAWRPKWAV